MELFERVRRGDLNGVKRLIQQGVDVNTTNEFNETVLICACKNGRTAVVQYLLDSGASVILGANPVEEVEEPLIAAVTNNHYDCVKLLLQHNANVHCIRVDRDLLMSIARYNDSYRIILLLLQYGAIPPASLDHILLLEFAEVDNAKTVLKLIDEKIINLTSVSTFLAAFVFAFRCGLVEMAEEMLSNDSYPEIEQRYPDAAYYSAKNNWPNILSKLLHKGVDVNVETRRGRGQTLLYVACKEGHESVVSVLLNNGADPNKLIRAHYLSLPLQIAVYSGNAMIVDILLKRGAKLNQPAGEPLLHTACRGAAECEIACEVGETRSVEHTLSTVRLLLQYGLDVNAISDDRETALYRACKTQQLQVAQILLEAGADVNLKSNGCYPLMAACEAGNLELINLLIKAGADVKCSESDNGTCLHALVNAYSSITRSPKAADSVSKLDIVNTIRSLLEGGVDVNARCLRGETALYRASEAGHEYIVRSLLESGAETSSSTSRCPLYAACERGYTQSNPQMETTTNSDKYPLLIACKGKFRGTAIMLLKHGADANVSKDKWTPLKLASANGDVELVKQLLRHGADVNQMQNVSNTALHVAVIHYCRSLGNEDFVNVVQTLLKNGAEINARNDGGETPLYMVGNLTDNKANLHIVQILLEHGSDPNMCPTYVRWLPSWSHYDHVLPLLSAAAYRGNNELVTLLIKFGARLNYRDDLGRTALHFAIDNDVLRSAERLQSTKKNGDPLTAEILLSAGEDANVVDNSGASPLYLACEKGKTEFVKLLLSCGVNPNMETADKYPIHAACRGQHCDCVKLLLEYNADLTVRDKNGKTALHHALESGSCHRSDTDKRADLVQLLLDGGVNVNAPSQNGESPFYVVCSKGLPSVAKKASECGSEVSGNSRQKLPINAACSNKHLLVVQLLLGHGTDPSGLGEDDKYRYRCKLPLHIVAADATSELVELLTQHGANIDVAGSDGNTALHHAIAQYARSLCYSDEVVASSSEKSVVDDLLENKADVNIANSSGETPLYEAVSGKLLDIVSKMLQVYGANPNKGSPDKSPLAAACLMQNVKLVDVLLKHGADTNVASTSCYPHSKHNLPLFVAVDKGNTDIIRSLLNAGADVNAMNHEGRSVVCFAAKKLTSRLTSHHRHSEEETRKQLSTICILLQRGASFNAPVPVDHSHLCSAVTVLNKAQRNREQYRAGVVTEFLQLMVKHGAMLLPDNRPFRDDPGTLTALATFDGKHEFIIDMFRAGAGFQLITSCCNAVTTSRRRPKSIHLCQAAVLAGYTPTAEELHRLQLAAADENAEHGVLGQLMNWLNEDRQQVPSLLRQCRIAIRQHLSVAVHYRTILPAVDKLPLPNSMKLYLQFDGNLSEVDLKELQTLKTTEETPYNSDNDYFCDYSNP